LQLKRCDCSAGLMASFSCSPGGIQSCTCRWPAGSWPLFGQVRATITARPRHRSVAAAPPSAPAHGGPSAPFQQADRRSLLTIEADWRVALFHAGLTLGDGGD